MALLPLALPILLGLHAAPAGSLEILLVRRVDTQPAQALDLQERIHALLLREGYRQALPPAQTRARLQERGVLAPAACEARRACVLELAGKLGAAVIVSVDVGHVLDRMAISLEALEPGGERLAQESFTVSAVGYPAGVPPGLERFAQALRGALPPPPPLIAAPAILPAPAPTAAPLPRAAAYGTGAGALVAGAAAVTLGVVGARAGAAMHAGDYDSAVGRASTLTHAESDRLATTGNAALTSALVCAVVSAALTGTTVYLWQRSGARR